MPQQNKEFGFIVATVNRTEKPQTLIYQGLHQCYSDSGVWDVQLPSERRCGEIAIERLLNGGRGHYSPLEHPQISFNCVGFPHSVVQQATRHRIGIAFSVQSFRYTGSKIYEAGEVWVAHTETTPLITDVFYLRPPGEYSSRRGKYQYTKSQYAKDMELAKLSARNYNDGIDNGMSYEHCRGNIPFDYRQNFLVSFNLRSLMHFLDMRAKADAQLEILMLAEMMFEEAKLWSPQIMQWYEDNRFRKGKLAP
jgi:thymidylate synthase (FAD)